MQKGDVIRARFVSLPEMSPGSGSSETARYPIRKGTIVYMHPKGRYLVSGGCSPRLHQNEKVSNCNS